MMTFESNGTEVDGVRFETVMPTQTISLPPRHNGSASKISFGLQITNLSSSAHVFLMFYLCPELLDTNYQAVQRTGPSQNGRLPDWYNFVLVHPGESIAFIQQGDLYWEQDKLNFIFRERSGTWWVFPNLSFGTYLLRMFYRNSHAVWNQQNARGMELEEIRDVWNQPVKSPPIPFELLLLEESKEAE